MSQMSAAYDALVGALGELQRKEPGVYLVQYMEDMTKWDKQAVLEWGDGQSFAWCVRECGTHIFHPDAVDGTGSPVWDWVRTVEECWTWEKKAWFWWDGKRLRRLRGRMESAQRELKGACTRADKQASRPEPHLWYGEAR